MTSPQTNGSGNGGKNAGNKRSAARWPDLLIGLLVLLLLGGFGVLLFGQRSSTTASTATPSTPSTTPATTAPADSTEIPAAPGTTTITPTPAPTEAQPEIAPVAGQPPEQASGQPTEQAQQPAQTPATTPATPAATTPQAVAPTTATGTTPAATPATPSTTAPTPTTSLNDIPTIVAAPIETTPVETAPTAQPAAPAATATDPAAAPNTPVSPAARTGGAVATSEARTPLRSDYRISLGTFSSEATANSRTAGVSGLGYRVYPIDLGSEVVAQIGPFADEAAARQALADVQRAYPGAILYPPRNRSLTGGTVSGTTPTPTSPAPATASPATTESTAPTSAAPAATPTPQAAVPAPDGPVYLQVGAFDRVEGAQNLVGTLREQGFAPTVNAPEGRKVTVLVGPFSGGALTRAEERLSSSGLDSFRVR